MPRFLHSFWIALIALLAAVSVQAVEIIPIDQVKPGMKGYGLSVFQGVTPVRFEVEVIDVMKNARPGMDAILVRCAGQGLEHSRIIAGMSGSPIYLDNRLAGALSFGWEFSLDPIAGVTPIEDMLRELDRPALPLPKAIPTAVSAKGLVPLATPLFVSGLDAPALAFLEEKLRPYGLVPMAGSGGGMVAGPTQLEMGGPIGGQLASGDVRMVGVGTVTYLDGSTVLAFGHAFFNGGSINLPLTTARVHTVLASQAISFKIASPGPVIGRLTQDRQTCIAGRVGEIPPQAEVEIVVSGPGPGVARSYHVSVAEHPILTPVILQAVLQQTMGAGAAVSQPNTADLEAVMEFRGYDPIRYQDTLFSIVGTPVRQMLEPALLVLTNSFENTRLEKLTINVTMHEELQAASIESLRAYPLEAAPGDTVMVYVSIKPFRAPRRELAVPVKIPEQAEGSLTVEVSGGAQSPPDVARPESVDDLIRALGKLYPARSLVVSYPLPGQGIDLEGERYRRLPPSVVSVLTPASGTEAGPVSDLRLEVHDAPLVMVGEESIQIRIKSPRRK